MIYLMRHGADPSENADGGWSAYGLTEKGKGSKFIAQRETYTTKGLRKSIQSGLSESQGNCRNCGKFAFFGLNTHTYLNFVNPITDYWLACLKQKPQKNIQVKMYWNALGWTETWPKRGESPEQFFHRIQSAWYEFKKQVGKSNVLLVSHGGVMNIILCLENGIPYTNKETRFQIKEAEIVQMDI